jgi:23S rRNA (cytidine1920-2'-O)/16S rRNA (cytidine1409-2'-O)-methyltransferase
MTTLRRLDLALVELGYYESRARARAAIEAGLVEIDGRAATKAAQTLPDGARVTRADAPHPYVSRGGVKLAAALDAFGFDPAGRSCLDVGASTGGFTQVLLERGAATVAAVDVGRGQLHPSLAGDPRVRSREATDARALRPEDFETPPQAIVCDVSFISLTLILPSVLPLAAQGAFLAALVKPQFESQPHEVAKGVVRDEAVRARATARARACVEALGWRVVGVMPSPIAGGDGNIEFLLGAVKEAA